MPSSPLLVILDLDDALMHSGEYELERALGPAENQFGKYHMYARPGARDFLQFLAEDERFQAAVWTSATADYAENVINWLFPKSLALEFVYSRDDLVTGHPDIQLGWDAPFGAESGMPRYLKDLQRVKKREGCSLERMVAIDDNPQFYQRQYSNLIRLPRWQGEKEDSSLFAGLQSYLPALADMENIRPAEKRGWLTHYVPGFSQGPDPLSLVTDLQTPTV